MRWIAAACLWMLLMAGAPVQGMIDPSLEEPAGGRVPVQTETGEDPFAPLRAAALHELEVRAPLAAKRFGTTGIPAPVDIPGYDDLNREDRRAAWFAWLEVSALAAADGPIRQWPAAAQEDPQDPVEEPATPTLGDPRGLRHLWSLESHGTPIALLPADEEGATFLVTSRGALRFGTPGGSPEWMVKPQGSVAEARVTDARGDGHPYLVLGTSSWNSREPSLTVVDGANGTVLFAGLRGEDRFLTWTLTDVDGDGTEEILGLDRQGMMAAYRLDGTEVYRTVLPLATEDIPVGTPLLYLSIYAARYEWGSSFGDVDGDGVRDLVVPESLHGSLYATGIGQVARPYVPMVATFSGTDGSLIWRADAGPEDPTRPSSLTIRASGDYDGDGRDDVLVRSTRFGFDPLMTRYETRYAVLSGDEGVVLSDDRQITVSVCTLACTSEQVEGLPFWPMGLADLDGDGAAELVGLGFESSGGTVRMTAHGHGPPDTPGLPSNEVYQHLLMEHDGLVYEAFGAKFRDHDEDGVLSFIVPIETAKRGENGNTDHRSHLYIVDASGAVGGPSPEPFGLWDVDATGQRYAWTTLDDRWGPIDDEWVRASAGFRLIISSYPYIFFDQNGDEVPDLLLEKTRGYLWVDGRTGEPLDDIVRPRGAWGWGVYEQLGRVVLFEENDHARSFDLVDLATGDTLWSVPWSDVEDGWVARIAELTGDGHLDLVTVHWNFRGFEPVFKSTVAPGETGYKVRDMQVDEVVWEGSWPSASFRVHDVLPKRPGNEILLVHRDEDASGRLLSLHVVGEETPRWTVALGSGNVARTSDGYILTESHESATVFEVLEAESGEVVTAHPLQAGQQVTGLLFERIDRDRFPDLVLSLVDEEREGESDLVVYDWANEMERARFPLLPHQAGGQTGQEDLEETGASSAPSRVFGTVGDWNGDGRADLALREGDRAVVRDAASGHVLAVAPGTGSPRHMVDLNGDKTLELGFFSDQGRLRFFSHRAGESLEDDEEAGPRVIRDVEGPDVDPESERFFDRSEDQGIPGPAPVLLLLIMGSLAGWRRRRL